MSPKGIRRMMKTRTNQTMQKYRCSYNAFEWSKHSQKRKLRVFLQYEGREMYYSDSREFCVPVVHISYLEVAIFIFHSKSMSVRVRLTCRTECTYMYCLVYFYAAFSRVLENKNLHHDQKRKLRYTLLCYVVELAVGSEQKSYFCYDSSDPVGPSMIPIKTIVIEQVRHDISSVKQAYVKLACNRVI